MTGSSPPLSGSSRGGFTLVEVLAALVIVSLGMLGIIQAVSQMASNSAYLRDKTFAHWVALNQLTTVRLANQAPAVNESSGETEMVGQKWRWTMKVTQTPVETMRRIDVSVAAEGAAKNSSLASVTGFYGTAVLRTLPTTSWDQSGVPAPGEGTGGGTLDQGNPAATPQPDVPAT